MSVFLAFFSSLFSHIQVFHQTAQPARLVNCHGIGETRISGGHNVGLMPFGCGHMESFEFPLPRGRSVLKWVTSDF